MLSWMQLATPAPTKPALYYPDATNVGFSLFDDVPTLYDIVLRRIVPQPEHLRHLYHQLCHVVDVDLLVTSIIEIAS